MFVQFALLIACMVVAVFSMIFAIVVAFVVLFNDGYFDSRFLTRLKSAVAISTLVCALSYFCALQVGRDMDKALKAVAEARQ